MSCHEIVPELSRHAATAGRKEVVERPHPQRLSKTLWDLDWHTVLPRTFADGFVARASSLEESSAFIRDHYASIFEERGDSPFTNRLAPAKTRYYELADFVQLVRDDRVVGLVVGAPADWATYYVRSAAVLPEHQGTAIVQRFFHGVLFPVLAAVGVERVEADVAPSNLAMVHIVTRAQFNASGTLLTERWGAHTRFTKFLCADSERVFLDQFCSGVKYQLREGRTLGRSVGGRKESSHEKAIRPELPLMKPSECSWVRP